MALGIIKLAKNLKEWAIYYKWDSRIKLIEHQRNKLLEQGYLTHEEALELEQLLVEAQTDYEYLIEQINSNQMNRTK